AAVAGTGTERATPVPTRSFGDPSVERKRELSQPCTARSAPTIGISQYEGYLETGAQPLRGFVDTKRALTTVSRECRAVNPPMNGQDDDRRTGFHLIGLSERGA